MAALVVRTVAIRLRFRAAIQSSSETSRKPPVRGVTAPTLLTTMCRPAKCSARATSSPGPSRVARSRATASTRPVSARATSSSLMVREPATTLAPSATRARVTAKPMPWLAPVTTATLSVRLSSMARR